MEARKIEKWSKNACAGGNKCSKLPSLHATHLQ